MQQPHPKGLRPVDAGVLSLAFADLGVLARGTPFQ
jgi:hypothetical protein